MSDKKVDHSYIDGYCAVEYYALVEGTIEWAESEGYEDMAAHEREVLAARPNWTYDPQGMMVSYDD